MFPYNFWDNSLWKQAARAGLRQISKLVSEGNISGASRLATTPGVLKPSAAGSQIRHLGRGNEGLSTMVAHPEHGIAARKLYDPRGITSPSMIARKEEVGRAIGDNPNFAKFLGSAQTPHGQGNMHFSEFVPQAKGAVENHEWTPSTLRTAQGANKTLSGLGYEGHDIRPGNMVQHAGTGQNKLIDYIPGRAGEMSSSPLAPEKISVSPQGSHLFNDPSRTGPSTTGGMLGRMLGGKNQATSSNINNSLAMAKTKAVGVGGLGVAPTMAVGTPPSLGRTSLPNKSPAALTAPLKPQAPATTPMRPQKPIQPVTTPMKPPSPATTVL